MAQQFNTQGQTRPVENPYEIWSNGFYEWRVLRKYQAPSREAANPKARWWVAEKLFVVDDWEYKHVFVRDVKKDGKRIDT